MPGPARRQLVHVWSVVYIIVAGVGLSPTGALAAAPPAEKIDCEVYATKRGSITLGFKAGNLLLQVGPEVTFSQERGIEWDKVVQGLIARYVEICSRYNAGLVTKQEYEQRIQEIDGLYREAQELERRLMAETRDHARSAHVEMDSLLKDRPAVRTREPDRLREELDSLGRRIDELGTTPLTPRGSQ